MNIEQLFNRLENAFNHDDLSFKRESIETFLDALEQGLIRAAYKTESGYKVDIRVKQFILSAFKVGTLQVSSYTPLSFVDKDNLSPRVFDASSGVRVVPGGSAVRRGAFVGKNVVIMPPSYINIGAYVDEWSLIDSHALVGSCAQVGKRVHISAGAQVGGVLEPVGALPIIIEDDVLIGGNCGLYEGIHVGEKAVIGAGVILTQSSKIYDLVHENVISANEEKRLCIPKGAVVVMGARPLSHSFANQHGLSIACPLIIKYRDDSTNAKTALEEALR